jgi:hypothetical protein
MSRYKPLVILLSLIGLGLTACVTTPEPSKVTPSSLTPQPILMFDARKEGRKLYTLNDEFPYCDKASGKVIVVPKWFQTDFASVPWYGQFAVNTDGPTARAAIVHDWLYAVGEKDKRKDADDIFYRAMLKWGVSEFEANIAYQAVRTGGESGYGLASDWVFINPAEPLVRLPFPKPKSGIVRILPQCQGFEALIASGWKAYGTDTKPQKRRPLLGFN